MSMWLLHELHVRKCGQAPIFQGKDVWVGRHMSMWFLHDLHIRKCGQASVLQGEDVWVGRHVPIKFLHGWSPTSISCARTVPGATRGWRSWLPGTPISVLRSRKQEPGSGLRRSEELEPEEEPGGAGRGLPRAETRWARRPLELRAGARRCRQEEQVPGWWCECPEDSAAFSGAWVWSPPFSPFLALRSPVGQAPHLPRSLLLLNFLSFLVAYLRTLFLEKRFLACSFPVWTLFFLVSRIAGLLIHPQVTLWK